MDHSHPTSIENTPQPDWFDKAKIIATLDARPILALGQHPLGDVLIAVEKMEDGEIFELVTPFVPAPLLDKVQAKGFLLWTNQEGDLFKSYFFKA